MQRCIGRLKLSTYIVGFHSIVCAVMRAVYSMEDFDICLGDPEQVEMSVYDLWIQVRYHTYGSYLMRFM